MDTELLAEADTWSPSKAINWSKLGSRYSLTTPNRGQVIKEFLKEQNIPAAKVAQKTARAPRRAKKRLRGGRTSFPMIGPVSRYRQRIRAQIASGKSILVKR